jgi:hypothetical protein
MAYFIFLKYLRSLEESRKNPHVKIPPKFPCANFQSLDKFKNLSSSLSAQLPLPAHSAFGPASPAGPSTPVGQSQHCRPKPLGPRASLVYLQKYVFFIDSRLPFSAPSLYPTADTWAPLVRFVFSTMPADPGRVSTAPPLPAPPAPRLGCRRAITTPHHSPQPINPLQTKP